MLIFIVWAGLSSCLEVLEMIHLFQVVDRIQFHVILGLWSVVFLLLLSGDFKKNYKGHLQSLGRAPFIHQNKQAVSPFPASNSSSSSFSFISTHTFLLYSSIFKVPWKYIEPKTITQMNLPILIKWVAAIILSAALKPYACMHSCVFVYLSMTHTT